MSTSRETSWSVVVGVAALLSQVIAGGLMGTSGLYYPYFQSTFQSSGAATSWLCSMTFVGYFIGNTIGSVLVNRFGYRVCALIGGLVSALGLSLCLVVDNIYYAFLFYGILGCIGNGIHGLAFLVAIINYFDKHRHTMQVSIHVGSGIGFAVYSTVIPIVIAKVGWRGCIFLQGGFSLNICVLGMLLFKRFPREDNAPKRLSINLSLFLKLRVFLFCVHEFVAMCSETATFVHLPVLIISKGFSGIDAARAFLCYAICNTLGKLTYSVRWKVDPTILYTTTVFVYGMAALCQPFLKNLIPIYICSGVSGFTANCFAGYTTVIILELVGTDNYTDVHGIVYMFRAAGSITSGPIAGVLFDTTRKYENVFFMIGTLITVACVLMVPIMKGKRFNPDTLPVDEEEIEPIKEPLPS